MISYGCHIFCIHNKEKKKYNSYCVATHGSYGVHHEVHSQQSSIELIERAEVLST